VSSREPKQGGRAGGASALVRERDGASLDELFAGAAERAGGRGVWLALDQIQDPHNVGAIFRTAAFFGIEGVILLRDRAAPLNATVYDIATGGVEVVPFSTQTNLSRALEQAKQAGVWVLGSSEHAEQSVFQVSRDRPWLLVLGNEEKGIRRLTREHCDVVCSLPPRGAVTSLNVSVAAGVLIAALTAER
jgi:23S rRNA (guanosine2251-2'-O)-methyltransferase